MTEILLSVGQGIRYDHWSHYGKLGCQPGWNMIYVCQMRGCNIKHKVLVSYNNKEAKVWITIPEWYHGHQCV